MLIIILLAVVFLIIFLLDAPKLIVHGYRKELYIFVLFLGTAFMLTILFIIDVNIPSPLKVVGYLVEDILGLRYD